MPLRRFNALVLGLPPDAGAWREPNGWTWERELAAATVELVDRWGRVQAQLAGANPRKLPKPVRIQRPGDQGPALRPVEKDPTRIAAWFGMHIAG